MQIRYISTVKEYIEKELIENKLDVILEEIGLTKQSFDGSVKDYRLSGAYRKLFVKPNGIIGRVIEYS